MVMNGCSRELPFAAAIMTHRLRGPFRIFGCTWPMSGFEPSLQQTVVFLSLPYVIFISPSAAATGRRALLSLVVVTVVAGSVASSPPAHISRRNIRNE